MSRLGSAVVNLALLAGATLAVLVALEIAFRAFPSLLPAGGYGGGRPHPELGVNVHGSRLIYNKVRFVVREPNAEGFMDVEHDPAKAPGTLRIGFFGDSYVEAIQVPLEAVFFRRLGEALAPAGWRPWASASPVGAPSTPSAPGR